MASNDIMIFCAPDYSEVYFVSDAYSKICGKPSSTFIKAPLSILLYVHPDDRNKLVPQSIRLKHNFKSSNIRIINQETNDTHWVIIRDYNVSDEENKRQMLAIIITDISDIIEAQQTKAMQDSVIAHQAKYVSMGEMIRAISHQWKQPLNALSICNQLMLDEVKDRDDKELMEYITTSNDLIEHMSNTIHDFRSFFKPDEGVENFDGTKVVIETLKLIDPQMRSLNINYTVRCGCYRGSYEAYNEVKPVEHVCIYQIKGKKNEFKYAIINIFQNAKDELMKLQQGERKIDITVACNGGFSISIADNAGGIKEEMMEKIFDADITMKADGTGLGLHLTRKIIEGMNGNVWAENHNDGARFNITLPVSKKQISSQ